MPLMARTPERIASDPLATGWARLADGEWDAAKASFEGALADEESPDALEGLSWDSCWLDDADAVFDARERAFRLYRKRGEPASAARMAAWLAADQLDFRGAIAVASGWLQRAARLLEPLERGPDHGWLAFHEGYIAHLSGDSARAGELGARAAEAGRRFDVPDLEMLGLALEGAVLVAGAQVEEGVRCLDGATGSPSSPSATGAATCSPSVAPSTAPSTSGGDNGLRPRRCCKPRSRTSPALARRWRRARWSDSRSSGGGRPGRRRRCCCSIKRVRRRRRSSVEPAWRSTTGSRAGRSSWQRGCCARRPRSAGWSAPRRLSCWSAPGSRVVSSRRRARRSTPCVRSSGWSERNRCARPRSWPRDCLKPRAATTSGRGRCSRTRSIASSGAARRSRPRRRGSSLRRASPPWVKPSWSSARRPRPWIGCSSWEPRRRPSVLAGCSRSRFAAAIAAGRPGSRGASARYWGSSPKGSPTGRLRSGWWSRATPSIATSPTSCASSTSPHAPPRPPMRCARACSTTPGDSQTWRYRVRPQDARFGRSQSGLPGLRSPQMKRWGTADRLLIEAAALARIEELAKAGAGEDRRSPMTTNDETEVPVATEAGRKLKAVTRAAWALGDYHRFAKETIWELGEVLVRACGISAGQRVLDVAAGTGNAAIRAAEAGAEAVASDLAPENFEAGRREAEAHAVELEWAEADAEALPFADGEFDVVTSSFGAIFTPDHRAVADEMLRVCRPGGTVGMLNFTPEGLGSEFFGTFAPYMPQTPGAVSPVMWGSEEHVRELLGDRIDRLDLTRD